MGDPTSPKLSPIDGVPKWSEEEEEEEGDEDEEDGEEEEDVEEEEPHFHTNPLFCGLYKPHLQITEGDIMAAPTMGGTQEVRGGVGRGLGGTPKLPPPLPPCAVRPPPAAPPSGHKKGRR